MSLLRRFLLFSIVLLSLPVAISAQQEPNSLTLGPSDIYRPPGFPDCYTVTVGNGANMLLDMQYHVTGGSDQIVFGGPQLAADGTATMCANGGQQVTTYTITGIRNTVQPYPLTSSGFVSINGGNGVPVTVHDVPPQLTSATFNPNSGYAGNDSYVLQIGNGANMNVDMQYLLDGVQQPDFVMTTDSNGNWSTMVDHYARTGKYSFPEARNTFRSDWVFVSSGYTVYSPTVTSLSISPPTVVAGSSYTMTVGNGGNVPVDMQYSFNGGPTMYDYAYAVGVPPNRDGTISRTTSPCMPVGTYTYQSILDDFNNGPGVVGTTVNAVLNVTAPAPVLISSVSPIGAQPGSTVNVTITGTDLCGASLYTGYPGLSVSSSPPPDPANVMTATFTIAPDAVPGPATIVLTGDRGSASFPFYIESTVPPTITGINPASCAPGTNAQVAMSGSNLSGATLSTTYSGLSFSNIVSTPVALSAQFSIASNAPLGTPVITVTTLAGSTMTAGFSIVASGCIGSNSGGPSSAKEYVYIGGRPIAMESWALGYSAPSAPIPLVLAATAPNTVQGSYPASTPGPRARLSGYQIKRNTTLLATVSADQLSFTDNTAAQNTAYTYSVIALDNTIPTPQNSAPASATVTTPRSTIPPATPSIYDVGYGEDPDCGCFVVEALWGAPAAYGGTQIASYTLYADGVEVWTGSDLTCEFLTYGFSELALYAYDNAGNQSQPGYWP